MYTDPSGSDISAVTANDYIQLKCNLSTSDILYTPRVFLDDNYFVRVVYSKEGAQNETSINSQYEGGWYRVRQTPDALLKRIKVYYTATSEATQDVTFRYRNIEGDIDETFVIDLSQTSDDLSTNPRYEITGNERTATYFCNIDDIGSMWKFSFSDTGLNKYKIKKVEILSWPVKYQLL